MANIPFYHAGYTEVVCAALVHSKRIQNTVIWSYKSVEVSTKIVSQNRTKEHKI